MSDESKLNVIEWDMMDRNRFLVLTVANSLIHRSVLYPFIVVKTRLQVQKKNTVYTGSLDAFKKIYRVEGLFRGLYKGYWINTIQVLSSWSYIITYEKFRNIITNYTNISDSKAKAFIAGGLSCLVSQTLTIPADVVSQHIIVALNTPGLSKRSNSADFKSTYFKPLNIDYSKNRGFRLAGAITREVYHEAGFRGFYRGYFASLICYVPSAACWWMLYGYFNEILFNNSSKAREAPRMLVNSVSGALSGAVVSIATNPLDLLRTNIQVHRPSSYRSAVKYLWKEDHWRIFSKGLTARLSQSCLSSALIVIGYEYMKRWSVVDEKYKDQLRR